MKTLIQIAVLILVMTFSSATVNAAKAKEDRTKAPVTKAADKATKAKHKAKQKVKHGGAEHEDDWRDNSRAAKSKKDKKMKMKKKMKDKKKAKDPKKN
ncbi:MAG: hypothetical protein COA74_10335 [Gammaproteobacteria bacterium]|nr:MAG: hypothetical protein COA74_10335 [Gammaproteobacteria bacterium]